MFKFKLFLTFRYLTCATRVARCPVLFSFIYLPPLPAHICDQNRPPGRCAGTSPNFGASLIVPEGYAAPSGPVYMCLSHTVPCRAQPWRRGDVGRRHDGVTTAQRCRHDAVTTPSRRRHDDVTTMSRRCRDVVTTTSRRRHDDVTTTSRRRHDDVTAMSRRRHDDVTTTPRQCHDDVTTTSRRCHDGVTTSSRRRHDDAARTLPNTTQIRQNITKWGSP
jgi:hypothetical protein